MMQIAYFLLHMSRSRWSVQEYKYDPVSCWGQIETPGYDSWVNYTGQGHWVIKYIDMPWPTCLCLALDAEDKNPSCGQENLCERSDVVIVSLSRTKS